MNIDDYREVRREVGRDTGKALAVFFIGLPLTIFAITWILL